MKNAFIFTVLTILLASSCTKTIDEVAGNAPQQLVVSAEMEAGTYRPILSVKSTLNNSEEVVYLRQTSHVQIFVNDELEPKDFRPTTSDERPFEQKDDESLWIAPDELTVEEGNDYRLLIDGSDVDLNIVEASTRVPFSGTLESKNLGSPIIITTQNSVKSQFKFDFSITDNNEEISYYHLTPYLLQQDGSKLYFAIEDLLSSENAIIKLSHRHGILIDNSIVDEANDVSFYMSIPHKLEDLDLMSMHVNFELRTVPKDYFLYHRSISQNLDSGASVFNPPTVTHTNFNSGYGLFATYVTKLETVAIN